MAYHFAEEDTESYYELPESFHTSVEKTLESVGITRFGNPIIEEYRKEGTEVLVKIQRGTGQKLDLTNARKVHGEILHHATMLHEGKIETIHDNGYVSLAVRARY